MWENFFFLVIFDTCDVLYNWSISLLYLIIYLLFSNYSPYWSLSSSTVHNADLSAHLQYTILISQLIYSTQYWSFSLSTVHNTDLSAHLQYTILIFQLIYSTQYWSLSSSTVHVRPDTPFKKKYQVLFLISLLRNWFCLMREDVDERDEEDGFEAGDRIGDAAIEVNPGLTLDAHQCTGTVVFIEMGTQSKSS